MKRNVTKGAEEDDVGDDQPRPEVADAILATSTTTLARGSSGPRSADDGEPGGGSSGSGGGTAVRNFRSTTDSTLPPVNIPIDSTVRVDFTAGRLRFTTEARLTSLSRMKAQVVPQKTSR